LLAPTVAITATAETLRLTPEEAVAKATSSNLHLRAAELEVKRARARLFWEGRLDNPELELAAATDGFGRAEGEALFEIAFVQRFPLTSRLKDAVELRRVEVALAEAEVSEMRRDLAYEVRKACVESAAARRETVLFEKLRATNAELAVFLKDAVGRGEASPLDLAGVDLAGRALTREAVAAKTRATQTLFRLRQHLGLTPDAEIEVAGGLGLPKGAPAKLMARDEVLARRPDYQVALVKGDVAKAELALAKAESLEDLALGFFAERERSVDAPGGLEGNTMIGVKASIPLPLRKKNEAEIASAEIGIDQAKLTVEGTALEIENELAAALEQRLAAYAAAREGSGEILELAEQNLNDFREAHASGQASLQQVQRAQEQKLELEKSALELERDYHLADAEVRHSAALDVQAKTTSK
jgi:outer membrane protein TolC